VALEVRDLALGDVRAHLALGDVRAHLACNLDPKDQAPMARVPNQMDERVVLALAEEEE
jgi:hypothetical protein